MTDTSPLIADLERTTSDVHVIANDLVKAAQRLSRSAPSVASLTNAITSVLPESHIKGASVLKVVLLDEKFELIASNFFDANENGILDGLETNYPQGSKYWWRLSSTSPKADGFIELTFIDRIADDLMLIKGPYKADRSSVTRAEFLKLVTSHVREVRFHSEQLHVKEPIDPVEIGGTNPSSKTSSGSKTVGLGKNYQGLTVKGSPMGKRQAANANILLNVAHKHNANEAATVAIIFAGIWESNLEQYEDNGTYWNVLAGSHKNFPGTPADLSIISDQATSFLLGGKGYRSAILLSQNESNPAAIASKAEGAVPFDSSGVSKQYQSEKAWPGTQKAIDEAKAIVQNAGGAAGATGDLGPGTTVETVQPYNFEIGTPDNPNESVWDGSQRLAQEVNWELFTDGPDLYYDADTTLIKQKPSAVIHRTDPEVVDWDYDWENRNIATQFRLTLLCEPFEFRAGEVLILKGFGCDNASTVKQPGKWLIADVTRQAASLASDFVLVQPTRPKHEPAPATTSVSVGGSSGDVLSVLGVKGGGAGVAAAVAAAQRLDAYRLPYFQGSRQLTDPPPKTGYDCSASTAWVLWIAGMYVGPINWAWVSGEFASGYGEPGEGKQMTIWANGGHVFIEFKLPQGHYQMNTSNNFGTGRGPRFGPWGGPGQADAQSGSFTPRHWKGT